MIVSMGHLATIFLTFFALFARPAFAATTQTPDCQIIGDADVYGLGVRLSFYLQWVASIVQLFFCPGTSETTRSAAVITVLAVFINILRNLNSETLVAVEWSMLYSVLTFLLSWNIPWTKAARCKLDRTGGSYFVLFFILAVYQIMCPYIIYHAWDYGPQPGCSAKFIFWTAIDAYSKGWIIFLKVSWTLAPFLPGTLYLLFAIYALLKWLTPWNILGTGIMKLLSKMEASFEDDEEKEKTSDVGIAWFAKLFAISCGAIGIGFLEATIKENNILFPDTHLTGSGQLLPLLIGTFTLVVTILDAIRAYPGSWNRK
ncbi:hypothetical protein N0V83_005114 [Neocucurbitaria cava]|uniref:Uncharacterized protein n=1 Tax=Neocucurbitaria cava TaxID=798079 RepID=A0A9W8Y8C3_9PLEO|nr:hypothetical protein N0V83_005114 [Neocucurbitaria cava]